MQIFFQFDSDLDEFVAEFFLDLCQIARDVPVFKIHELHVPSVHGVVVGFDSDVLSELIRAVKSVQIFELFQQPFKGDVAGENLFPRRSFQIRGVYERTPLILLLFVRIVIITHPRTRHSRRRRRRLFLLHPPLFVHFTPLLRLQKHPGQFHRSFLAPRAAAHVHRVATAQIVLLFVLVP